MEWIRLFHRILTLVLTPFALVGCVAVTTAPITLSLWLIWLLVAIARPATRTSWYSYTLIIAFLLLCVATVGLVAAIDPNQSARDAGLGAGFFLLCLVFSAVMALIWRRSPATSAPGFRAFSMVIGGLFILGCLAIVLRYVLV